jgi:putative membrane protein
MKRIPLLLTAAALTAMLVSSAAVGATEKTTTHMSSPDMAAVLLAANLSEVEVAEAAMSQLAAADVKNFANMLIVDHKRALTNVKNVLAANKIVAHVAAPDAVKIRDKSQHLVTNFSTSNANIDRQYIVAEIEGHEQLLDLMDHAMIPAAHGDVLTMLQSLRFTVDQHLERARLILGTLAK